MAKEWDVKQVREAIERMAFIEERGPKEIHERLHAQEAGLPWPVTISLRQVNHYLRQIRERRVKEAAENPNAVPDEIAQLERQMIDRLAQEVAHIEQKRLGKLTAEDARTINAAHRALIDIEKRTRKFTKRKLGSSEPAGPSKPTETPLGRMAREERERQAALTSGTDPDAESVRAEQPTPQPSAHGQRDSQPAEQRSSDAPTGPNTSSQVDRQGGQSLSRAHAIQARRASSTADHPA